MITLVLVWAVGSLGAMTYVLVTSIRHRHEVIR